MVEPHLKWWILIDRVNSSKARSCQEYLIKGKAKKNPKPNKNKKEPARLSGKIHLQKKGATAIQKK